MAAGMNSYTNSVEVEDRPREISTFAFFDLETTGLNPPVKITELSIVAIRRNVLMNRIAEFDYVKKKVDESSCDLINAATPRTVDKFSICIDPGIAIEPRAGEITGLTNEDLQHHGRFDDSKFFAINQFLRQLEAPICLVAHNGDKFDFPILKRHLDEIQKTFIPGLLCVDSLIGLRQIIGKRRIESTAQERPEDVPEASRRREEAQFDEVLAEPLAGEAQVPVRNEKENPHIFESLPKPALSINKEKACQLATEVGLDSLVSTSQLVIRNGPELTPVRGRADALRREEKEGSPRTELAELTGHLSLEPQVEMSVGHWSMGNEEITKFGLRNEPDTIDMIIAELSASDHHVEPEEPKNMTDSVPYAFNGNNSSRITEAQGLSRKLDRPPGAYNGDKTPPRVTRTIKISTPTLERRKDLKENAFDELKYEKPNGVNNKCDTNDSESENMSSTRKTPCEVNLTKPTSNRHFTVLQGRQSEIRSSTSAPAELGQKCSNVIRSFVFRTPTSKSTSRLIERSNLSPKRLFTPKETITEPPKPPTSEFSTPKHSEIKMTPSRIQQKVQSENITCTIDAVVAKKRLFVGDGAITPRKMRNTAPKTYKLGDLYQYYFDCEMVSAHEAEADVKALLAVAIATGSEFVEWIDRNATDFNCVKAKKYC